MLSNASGRTRGPVLRAVIVVAALAVWLAVGAFGGMAQGTLSQVQENDSAAFLPESAESTRAQELAQEFNPDQPLPALVVLEPTAGGAITDAHVGAAEAFAQSLADHELPDGRALGEVLKGRTVVVPAQDGEALLIPVGVDEDVANDLLGDTGERVVNVVVDALRGELSDPLTEAGLTAWVTGPAGFVADLVGAFGGIDGVLLLVALVVVLIILFIVYRSPILPFTVLLTSVFALCAAALVVKPLAGNGVLLLNGQSQGILSILVVGAATDYGLLVVARYREELTRHQHPAAAMRAAWRASIPPITASAGTVIIGLLCLLLSDLGSNASLGPVGAIGIASSVLAALTLLPALLLVAGRRSRAFFWPRMPAYHPDGEAPTRRAGLWERIAEFVMRHTRAVWLTTAVVLLGLAAFLPTLQADGTGESEVFLTEVESVAGEEVLARHFDAGQVQPVFVIAEAAHGDAIVAAVNDLPEVTGAELLSDEAGEPIVVEGRIQAQVITADPAESQEATATVAQVRDVVHDIDSEALVGGAAAQRLDTQETAARDLRTIIPVVLVVIFLMLALLLRSLVAPLVILVVNVLSFAATMGLSAIFFNHVFGFPGADAAVPLFGFVFLVALSIDYSIFLMTRVREEARRHGTREGVRTGLAVTGGVITSAGLVLAATFSALVVIPLLFLAQLAFIVAVGVLIDTFVVRTLLLPGLVTTIGHRVWWPWQRHIPADGPREG